MIFLAKSLYMLFPLPGHHMSSLPTSLYSKSLSATIQEVFFAYSSQTLVLLQQPPAIDMLITHCPPTTKSDFPHQSSPTLSSGHRGYSKFTCWMNKWNTVFNWMHSGGPHCGLAYSTAVSSFLSSLPAVTLRVLIFKLKSIICLSYHHSFFTLKTHSKERSISVSYKRILFQKYLLSMGYILFFLSVL